MPPKGGNSELTDDEVKRAVAVHGRQGRRQLHRASR
jgi:cytochrome c5